MSCIHQDETKDPCHLVSCPQSQQEVVAQGDTSPAGTFQDLDLT